MGRARRPRAPGLRELEGVWTSREATSMNAIPRRLLILGGGPVGVEMAQAVRRLGGEVAVIDMAEHVLAREPAPLGEALGEVLGREGIELVLSANGSAGSASKPSASSRTPTEFRSTRTCARRSICGRSATSTGSGR